MIIRHFAPAVSRQIRLGGNDRIARLFPDSLARLRQHITELHVRTREYCGLIVSSAWCAASFGERTAENTDTFGWTNIWLCLHIYGTALSLPEQNPWNPTLFRWLLWHGWAYSAGSEAYLLTRRFSCDGGRYHNTSWRIWVWPGQSCTPKTGLSVCFSYDFREWQLHSV